MTKEHCQHVVEMVLSIFKGDMVAAKALADMLEDEGVTPEEAAKLRNLYYASMSHKTGQIPDHIIITPIKESEIELFLRNGTKKTWRLHHGDTLKFDLKIDIGGTI